MKTGRPKIKESEVTVRVGFSVNEGLWRRFLEKVETDQISQSELFRRILERFLKTGILLLLLAGCGAEEHAPKIAEQLSKDVGQCTVTCEVIRHVVSTESEISDAQEVTASAAAF